MIGSANSCWLPTSYAKGADSSRTQRITGYFIATIGTTNTTAYCFFDLPTNRGSKKLYVKGCRILLNAADANNYISGHRVFGVVYTGGTSLYNNTTTYNSAQLIDNSFTAVDCSGYNMIGVYIQYVTNGTAVKFSPALLDVYYG